MKRVFLGINIDKSSKNIINMMLKESFFDIKGFQSVKNVDNYHITVHFYGSIDDTKIKQIETGMDTIKFQRGIRKFTIRNINGFPNINRARVIFLDIIPSDDIISSYNIMVKHKLFPESKKRFIPHITIGRCKKFINRKQLKKAVQQNQDFKIENVGFDNVTLFESQLTPSGSIYKIIKQIKLN